MHAQSVCGHDVMEEPIVRNLLDQGTDYRPLVHAEMTASAIRRKEVGGDLVFRRRQPRLDVRDLASQQTTAAIEEDAAILVVRDWVNEADLPDAPNEAGELVVLHHREAIEGRVGL